MIIHLAELLVWAALLVVLCVAFIVWAGHYMDRQAVEVDERPLAPVYPLAMVRSRRENQRPVDHSPAA